MHLTDERVAGVELDYLAQTLQPPCALGAFHVTGLLARSATALLFTARGPAFGETEGVLKLTGSAYAPILARELALLQEVSSRGIDGVVRPLASELVWLAVGGERADRPAAALPLPFLTGGDLPSLAARVGRTGGLGPHLALEVARPLGEALRSLLTELDRPVSHGDVRAQNVLLPAPSSSPSEAVLIDLDAARELEGTVILSAAKDPSLAADLRGLGEILTLLAGGTTTGNRPFDTLASGCLTDGHYSSMADKQLWRDLAAAEQEVARRLAGRRGLLARASGWLRR